VRANGRDVRELALARRAYDLWRDLGYVRTGHLQLTEREGDLSALAGQVERQRAAAIASELVERARLRELEPDLAPSVVGAVLCPDDGIANHTATTLRVADAARAEGVEIRERTSVTHLRLTRGRVGVETTAGDGIEASSIVLALNAGLGRLAVSVVDLPLFTVYPQVLLTAPVEPAPVRHLIGHAHRRLALKALPGGEVMISGGWLGSDGAVQPDEVSGNLAEAAAVYPSLVGIEIAVADASRAESVTPDLVPVIDRFPGTENAFIAAGWSGHGWAIAPAVGELLAEWIVTGRRPPAFDGLDLARFGTP
jgi:sarcosine oxidase subunit beta